MKHLARLALAAGVTVTSAVVASAPVVAAVDCAATSWSVGTSSDLDDAIGCFNAKSAGAYTITLTGDIALTASTPTISNGDLGAALLIDGAGHAVDGQDTLDVRPLHVGLGTTVTLTDLVITGGRVTGSGSANHGGGLLNEGTLERDRVTVMGNTAESRGGGLAHEGGSMLIVDSTIAMNTVAPADGDVGLTGGGGIYSSSTMVIRNSTISSNDATGTTAVGGGIDNNWDLTLESVTITENQADSGPGIYMRTNQPVELAFQNTIIAENGAADCYFETAGSAQVVDNGNNFVGQVFSAPDDCRLVDGVNGNIVGGAVLLEPLGSNGGTTMTHRPQLDSPVVDAGDTTLAVDQRGVARPQGAADDIGAVESQLCGADTWSVDTLGEYEVAIDCFNAKTDPGEYTISVTTGFGVTNSPPPIDNTNADVSLVIDGDGTAGLDGGQLAGVRPITVAADTVVEVRGLQIYGGSLTGAANRGAGILNSGDLTLTRSFVADSITDDGGAAIDNAAGATLLLDQSSVYDNQTSAGPGAGIHNDGDLTVRNSTISGNTGATDGGGIASTATATLAIESSTIALNDATDGAGIHVGAAITVDNSIIAQNTTGDDCWASTTGLVTDAGHNLVGTQSDCEFVDGIGGTIVGADPVLGPLRNNDASTIGNWTHAVLPGSPAIDAGATALTVDQRDKIRPVGSDPDIGAFEDAQLGRLTVTKTTPSPSSNPFEFTLIGGTPSSTDAFVLNTFQGNNDGIPETETFDIVAGSYRLTESAVDGWAVAGITCDDAGVTIDVRSGAADFSIAEGDEISCTFDNVVNIHPLAVDDGYQTQDNTTLTVAAPGVLGNDSEPDVADGPDPLTALLVTGPAHGTLTLNADGSFTYVPDTDYTGSDSFTYRVDDGLSYSNTATVLLDVGLLNTAPVGVDDSYTTPPGTVLDVTVPGVLGNDVSSDGDALTATVVTDPTHGTLVLNADGSFTYTPDAAFAGVDSFTYVPNDPFVAGTAATVTIEVVDAELDAAARFVPASPVRLFDTRPLEPAPGPKGTVAPDSSIDLQIGGVQGVPDDAVAVVMNVAAVNSIGPGFVTVWPKGETRPLAATHNLTAPGQIRPNLVTVPLGDDGMVSIYTSGGADFTGDLAGYYVDTDEATSAGRIVTLEPARVFDTRPEEPGPGPKGELGAGDTIDVQVTGVAGIPDDGVAAVVMNLAGIRAADRGFVTAYPTGAPYPLAAVLNMNEAGDTNSNLVILPVGENGRITFFAEKGAFLSGDVTGYVTDSTAASTTEGLFVPLSPVRAFDTRPDEPGAGPKGYVGADTTIDGVIGSSVGIPSSASGAVLNVAGVRAAGRGYVTGYPADTDRPLTATLNLGTVDDIRSNAAILEIGADDRISFYSEVGAHLVVDTSGYLIGTN